jgi:hypothetical protein
MVKSGGEVPYIRHIFQPDVETFSFSSFVKISMVRTEMRHERTIMQILNFVV